MKFAVVQDQLSMLEEGGVLLLVSLAEAFSHCTSNDTSIWEETWASICPSQCGDLIPGLSAQVLSSFCLMTVSLSMQTGASPTGEIPILKQSADQNVARLRGAEFHVPVST